MQPVGSYAEGICSDRKKMDAQGGERLKAVGISDIGKCRKNNEDAYYVSDETSPLHGLYIVADGVGGSNAGEVASNGAILSFLEYVKSHKDTQEVTDLMTGGFQYANQLIFEESKTSKALAEMGTTMVAAIIQDDKAYIAHVGDSRAYLMKKEILSQLTTDHSYVMELVKKGEITKEQAAVHPDRNSITRAVGIEERVETDLAVFPVEKGDLLLLCTDGLSDSLTEEELAQMLRQKKSIRKKAKQLVETANLRGGYDNITLVLVEI